MTGKKIIREKILPWNENHGDQSWFCQRRVKKKTGNFLSLSRQISVSKNRSDLGLSGVGLCNLGNLYIWCTKVFLEMRTYVYFSFRFKQTIHLHDVVIM